MRKICIIDSYSWKNFHETFNASLLVECLSISNDIIYFTGLSSLKSLKYLTINYNLSNVSFNIIPVIKGKTKIHTLLRLLLSSIYNCILLFKIKKYYIIIYNYNNLISLPLINFFNILLKKKIVIFCHGEFEIFNNLFKNQYTFFWKNYFNILKFYFTKKKINISTNIIFLVLGDNIKLNLKNHISNIYWNKLYSIDHSYIPNNLNKDNNKNKKIIKFGIIGQIRKEKNISDIILLAKNLSFEIINKKLKLIIIGFTSIMNEELKASGLIFSNKNYFLPREEYNKQISSVDYILFFYNENMYQFTASGLLLDVLNTEKPIIALKNNYFDYFFRKYGELGKLVNSIDDMTTIIKKILEGKEDFIFDFKYIQEKLKPENIAYQIENIFEQTNF
jgi:glycosyltransferase involved in cell wall biosynthesis